MLTHEFVAIDIPLIMQAKNNYYCDVRQLRLNECTTFLKSRPNQE